MPVTQYHTNGSTMGRSETPRATINFLSLLDVPKKFDNRQDAICNDVFRIASEIEVLLIAV